MIPGEIITAPGEIELNAGREAITLTVSRAKMPPTMSRVNSFLEATARKPSPAPSGSEPTSPMNTLAG